MEAQKEATPHPPKRQKYGNSERSEVHICINYFHSALERQGDTKMPKLYSPLKQQDP
jgi:hypothetical protein